MNEQNEIYEVGVFLVTDYTNVFMNFMHAFKLRDLGNSDSFNSYITGEKTVKTFEEYFCRNRYLERNPLPPDEHVKDLVSQFNYSPEIESIIWKKKDRLDLIVAEMNTLIREDKVDETSIYKLINEAYLICQGRQHYTPPFKEI